MPKTDPRDAWLAGSGNASSRTATNRRGAGFNYSRFDSIVDSDDDDDDNAKRSADVMPPKMAGMPPELKRALAKVEAEKMRGDQADIAAAMVELEARLQEQPAEFKRQFLGGAAAPARAQSVSSAAARSQLHENMPPGETRERIDAQLAEIERQHEGLNALSEDPSKLPHWLAGMGISPSEIDAAHRTADPQAALRQLAEECIDRSIGPTAAAATSAAASAASSAAAGQALAAVLAAATAASEGAEGGKSPRRRGGKGKSKGNDTSSAADAGATGDADDVEDISTENMSTANSDTMGGGKGCGAKSGGNTAAVELANDKAARMRAELEASKAKLAAQMAEV